MWYAMATFFVVSLVWGAIAINRIFRPGAQLVNQVETAVSATMRRNAIQQRITEKKPPTPQFIKQPHEHTFDDTAEHVPLSASTTAGDLSFFQPIALEPGQSQFSKKIA